MIGTNAIVSGISAGQKLVAVGLFAPATGFQVVLSKKVTERLAASGVTSKSPIKERVQAMKGLVIASNGPGNAVDSILRATLTEYGVAPDGDLTLRAIPDPGAMSAAFREGKVDGFIFGLPFTTQPVVAGVGEVWINYIEGDVPSLADAPSGIVVTTRDFAAKHEDELVKFNTALAKAYQAVYATPDKVKEKLRGMAAFAKLDPKLFDAAFDAAVPIFDNGPIATEREFQQMIRIYNSDASITKKSDASFDQVFDISFAQKAAGK
jgi:NitT/TauT family transport system substrate-binding protein